MGKPYAGDLRPVVIRLIESATPRQKWQNRAVSA
jgi:hypothetical protein